MIHNGFHVGQKYQKKSVIRVGLITDFIFYLYGLLHYQASQFKQA